MFPWRTVGMHVPSSSSHVLCVQRMGDCRKTNAAKLALITLFKRCKTGPDDIVYTLVFFSTFEELNLPMTGPMEDSGVVKLYDPSPTPCLYVVPAENMVGRVPLIPLFLTGNSTLTIPHMFSKCKEAGFPFGCADAAALDGRRGSNIYEVNPWLWQFGRGKPRLGGLSIEQTGERKDAASDARHKRAAETKRARKTA